MPANLLPYKIILGSGSPRRKELLAGLGIPFEVRAIPGVDESYPARLKPAEIAGYIAAGKAKAYLPALRENELLITADTIVCIGRQVLGKPAGRADALRMLRMLSGKTHEVITGVCLTSPGKSVSFSSVSSVSFAPIADEDIIYYVDTFHPYDKAGAYGIQEWIVYVAVEGIRGSFYNVMGLPVQQVYRELRIF